MSNIIISMHVAMDTKVKRLSLKEKLIEQKQIAEAKEVCFCISSLRLDNLPFKDFVVSAIINIPLVTRHLLASVIYSDQFFPIKDNENTATSKASSANGTFFISHAVTLGKSLFYSFILLEYSLSSNGVTACLYENKILHK